MEINNINQLDQSLESGSLTDVGGYPKYWVTKDGGILSFEAISQELELIKSAIENDDDPQWQVIGCDINWEQELRCDHLNKEIQSAYGE